MIKFDLFHVELSPLSRSEEAKKLFIESKRLSHRSMGSHEGRGRGYSQCEEDGAEHW